MKKTLMNCVRKNAEYLLGAITKYIKALPPRKCGRALHEKERAMSTIFKNSIMIALVCILCVGFIEAKAGEFFSREEAQGQFQTTEYLYEQCKDSLSQHKHNPELFSKTYCYASMAGFLSGYTVAVWAVPVHDPNDSCSEAKAHLVKEFQSRLCLPQDFSFIKAAKDFVRWIEGEPSQVGNEKILQEPALHGLGSFFTSVYVCKPL
ncbi:MAG: hypothetical protein KDK54_22685 [Leptospiraceae bacterium]|nr:hypothetical protein [Leptospiraceae bacterium]